MTQKRNPVVDKNKISDRLYTLAETGESMGISRERVRQIEADALGKLREHYHRRGIHFDDLNFREDTRGSSSKIAHTEEH